MDETYSVTWENHVVGQVRLVRNGLYTEVLCRCNLSPGAIYRLWECAGKENINLGVLYPECESFVLRRRVTTRRLSGENPAFSVWDNGRKPMRFVPVREDEPFDYLPALMQSRFAVRDGVPGLLIPEDD